MSGDSGFDYRYQVGENGYILLRADTLAEALDKVPNSLKNHTVDIRNLEARQLGVWVPATKLLS